jgi:excisionase family DNA binding protein
MHTPASAEAPTAPAFHAITTQVDVSLVVTVREATQLLRIGRTTLYKLMGERDVTTVKIGGASRILRSSIDDYVKRAAI